MVVTWMVVDEAAGHPVAEVPVEGCVEDRCVPERIHGPTEHYVVLSVPNGWDEGEPL